MDIERGYALVEPWRKKTRDALGGRTRQADGAAGRHAESQGEKKTLRPGSGNRCRAVTHNLCGQPQYSGGEQEKSRKFPARYSGPLHAPQCRGTLLEGEVTGEDRKSTRLNSSHVAISYAVFCLKKKK